MNQHNIKYVLYQCLIANDVKHLLRMSFSIQPDNFFLFALCDVRRKKPYISVWNSWNWHPCNEDTLNSAIFRATVLSLPNRMRLHVQIVMLRIVHDRFDVRFTKPFERKSDSQWSIVFMRGMCARAQFAFKIINRCGTFNSLNRKVSGELFGNAPFKCGSIHPKRDPLLALNVRHNYIYILLSFNAHIQTFGLFHMQYEPHYDYTWRTSGRKLCQLLSTASRRYEKRYRPFKIVDARTCQQMRPDRTIRFRRRRRWPTITTNI